MTCVRLIVCILGVLTSHRTAGGPPYEAALSLYLAGDFEKAVGIAVRLRQQERNLQEAAVLTRSLSPFQRTRLQAMLALQTEVVIQSGRPLVCAGPEHIPESIVSGLPRIAPRVRKSALLEALERKDRGSPDYVFLSAWYLFVIAYDQGRGDLASAHLCATSAPVEIQQDADMLLAQGALDETGHYLKDENGIGIRGIEPDLSRAAAKYRQAIAVNQLLEAQLRQAKILTLLNDKQKGCDLFAPLQSVGDADIAYLARMMLGDCFRDAKQHERAAESFRSASSIARDAQSPFIALAMTSYMSGRRRDAAAMLRETLQPSKQFGVDPWSWYVKGTARRAAGYLKSVRTLAIR